MCFPSLDEVDSGTLRVDVRLTPTFQTGDLGHINHRGQGGAGEEKPQRKRKGALVRRRGKGRGLLECLPEYSSSK